MKFVTAALLMILSAAASAQTFDFGPSNMSQDFETMNKATVAAVESSPAVAAYAATKRLGAVTEVEYVYSGSLRSGTFLVSTAKGCTFEAKVRLSNFAWVASPVVGSENCR